MLKIIEDSKEIKNSNLVFLAENQADIEKLKSFNIDDKIIKNIKEKIKKWKSEMINFFIWEKNLERLFLIYHNSKDKNIDVFLWNCFRSLPNNFTILSNNEQNSIKLLNSSLLGRYKYTEFKTDKKEEKIYFLTNKKTKELLKERLKTIENILFARNLSSKPSNILYPESFVDIVKGIKFKNFKLKILNSKDIEKKWLNLITAVWSWSKKKPYVIILEKIVDKNKPTIWIVCKWITFDTWWIQVKPGNYMYEMKWDMSWAWTWIALAKELDWKKLNVNLVICLVLAENQISDESYRPSDIIKSYSWKTVDIIHTDAEWRLILADGISYISKNYKLDKIITLATLTWACVVALWYRYVWLFWNDEKLIQKLLSYSKENTEKYWRLPFDEYYIEKTKWKEADLENLNNQTQAWATMWAAFLYNFVMNKEKFVHIDMAWAINSYEAYSYVNQWMTGFGVDSLSKIIEEL